MKWKYYRQESRHFTNALDVCMRDPPRRNGMVEENENFPEIDFTEEDKKRMLQNILAKIHSIQTPLTRDENANDH